MYMYRVRLLACDIRADVEVKIKYLLMHGSDGELDC